MYLLFLLDNKENHSQLTSLLLVHLCHVIELFDLTPCLTQLSPSYLTQNKIYLDNPKSIALMSLDFFHLISLSWNLTFSSFRCP